MEPEERIAQLEQQVADLQSRYNTLIEIFSNQSGVAHAYHQAMLAFAVATPPHEVFDAQLRERLAQAEAVVVGEVKMESHVDGAQLGQQLLLLARDEARRLYSQPAS